MTNDESNLAAIEAKLTVVAIGCDSPADVGVNDVRWLIAEVRRLQTPANFGKTILDMIETHCNRDDLPNEDKSDGALNAWLRMRAARDEALAEVERLKATCEKGKAIIHDIADGSEYRRGREDERAAVVALAVNDYFLRDFARCIERGEHLEEPDAR